MLNRPKLGVVAAGVLAMAVVQAASALTYTISNGPIVTPLAGYSITGLSYANPTGFAVGTESITGGRLVWEYNSATNSSVAFGLIPADSVDYESASATLGTNGFNSSGFTQNQVSLAGDVIGVATRGYSSTGASFVSLGQDAWLYVHGSTLSSTGSSILTPKLVGQIAPLSSDPNGDGFASIYTYTLNTGNANGHTFRSSTASYVNSSATTLGTSNRYTGQAGVTSQVGTDVWINTGSGPSLLGLGVSTANTGVAGSGYYYYTQTVGTGPTLFVTRTTSLVTVSSNSSPGLQSLDNTGLAAGTSTRYQSNTAAATCGADAWMYNAGGLGGTVQIGLVGTTAVSSTVTDSTGTTASTVNLTYEFTGANTFTTRSSAISGVNGGYVVGTSAVYNGTTNAVGNRAWIYTPGTTPGTATALGATAGVGTYAQVGLNGSVAPPSSPQNLTAASLTNMGYVNSLGSQTTTVTGVSNTGKAAGTQVRFLNNGTAGFGNDGWYYDGTTTKNISPWSPTLTSVQYFSGATPITSAAASLLATNYNTTTFASALTVTSMNPLGTMVGGNLSTYNGTNQINSAGNAFVYDATTGIEYVLIPPTVTTKTDNSFISIKSINDNGVVAGTFNNYGGAGSTVAASYIYEWSIATGFVIIQQISGASANFLPLNNALATEPGWGSLFNTIPNINAAMYLDGNGALYGPGNTTASGTGATTSNGVWAITVPEPSSLAILGLGVLTLVRRRSGARASR